MRPELVEVTLEERTEKGTETTTLQAIKAPSATSGTDLKLLRAVPSEPSPDQVSCLLSDSCVLPTLVSTVPLRQDLLANSGLFVKGVRSHYASTDVRFLRSSSASLRYSPWLAVAASGNMDRIVPDQGLRDHSTSMVSSGS